MDRLLIFCGSIAGFGAVAMAAVASHALSERLDVRALESVRAAIQMAGWHAPAILFCGLWLTRGGGVATAAGVAFIAGLVLFCGGVAASVLSMPTLARLAPSGGVLLLTGWLLLAISVFRA